MSDDVRTLIGHWERLHSNQANFRMLWNTIAQYVLPAWDNFIGYFEEGIIRTTRIFDATAITDCERFAAIMESLLTPRTQMWHDIVPADEALKDDEEVTQYCSLVRKALFTARYRPRANYTSQVDECYLQLGAFGNTAMLIDEAVGQNLIYRSIPLNEIVWALDAAGMVDQLYRKFPFTAHQCMQMAKTQGWKIPDSIKEAHEKNPFHEFQILHCVRPNEERVAGAMGPKGMPYASWYIWPDEKKVLAHGGYRTFPYAVGRYRMAPREHYGRSPAAVALPAIRTLNEQKKTALRAGQKAVDPPLLLADEGALTPFNLRAGALNYGMLSADGVPLVQPLEIKSNWEISKEMMELEAQAIHDPFLTSVMQILAQNPGMTATEALIRAQEKGILITPAMGRQQSEFLGPQIIREIDILEKAGMLPPMPKQLAESANHEKIKTEYTSPLAKLMRAEEAQTIMTSVQGLGSMASIMPGMLDLVDEDETGREFLEASGFPVNLILDPDKLAAKRQQKQQQAEANSIAQTAPGASQAVLNLAKAHQAMNPEEQPPQ